MIDFVLSTVIPILIVVVILSGSAVMEARKKRRMFELFTTCRCPTCGEAYSLEDVQQGLNTSPREELWSDGTNHLIHCHPVCRCVVCAACGHLAQIRYNTQGEFFGPELAVRKAPSWISIGEDGRPKREATGS